MKLLVIGGSYFLGKHFVQLASNNHEITVINRGNRPFNQPHITEYKLDRHDVHALSSLPNSHFDAIIDFCAYQKNDIATIVTNLKATCNQYIFISTCDVYKRNTSQYMDENSEFETRTFDGEAGEYIKGKVALEQELISCCKERGIAYTSFRPAFIFGPDNYAPREGIYFHWITSAGQIIHPTDATGQFQMVYVKDVALSILHACNNPIAYNKAYNLCNPEILDYDSFADLLAKATGISFEKATITTDMIIQKNIPLPFPLTKEESQYYESSLSKELNIQYTPLITGMRETFAAYMQTRG